MKLIKKIFKKIKGVLKKMDEKVNGFVEVGINLSKNIIKNEFENKSPVHALVDIIVKFVGGAVISLGGFALTCFIDNKLQPAFNKYDNEVYYANRSENI